MKNITHVEVRMYRMGTGDCFAVKFFSGKTLTFKMMFDAGVWSGSADDLRPYIEDLKDYMENYVDVLVVTHEHKDHVYAFEACKELFTDGKFHVDEIWMAWTENDKSKTIKKWKDNYGDKKRALGIAAQSLESSIRSEDYLKQYEGSKGASIALNSRQNFVNVLSDFAALHMSVDETGKYIGGLAGMEIAKHDIRKTEIRYFNSGDILSGIKGLNNIKIYVLGPPSLYQDLSKEAGGKGETYEHNKVLKESGAFGVAVTNLVDGNVDENSLFPFDPRYIADSKTTIQENYESADWRRIDQEWLFSAGSFALRMNSLTNNLSLALAFEFGDGGKVMLFPGDAEYGSWASWHSINWPVKKKDSKTQLTTEDLLNRTVFYKVAHHLSHNGTAEKLGLEMMNNQNLVAMATLDYHIISNGWKSTMPNRALFKELLYRTKGRVLIMNEKDIYYDFNNKVPITEKIKEARKRLTKSEAANFNKSVLERDLFIQFKLQIQDLEN